MKRRCLLQALAVSAGGVFFPFSLAMAEEKGVVQWLTVDTEPDGLRLVFSVSGGMTTHGFLLDQPHRLVLDFGGGPLVVSQELAAFNNSLVKKVRYGAQNAHSNRLVFDLHSPARMETADNTASKEKREWMVWLKPLPQTQTAAKETIPERTQIPETAVREEIRQPVAPQSNHRQTRLTVQPLRQEGDTLQVTIWADGNIQHRGYILQSPDRGVVDFHNSAIYNIDELKAFRNEFIKGVRIGHPVANGTRLVFDLKAQAGLDTSLSDLPNATGQELVLRLNLGPMAKQMQATADKKKQQPEAVATKPVLPDTPPPPSVSAQPSGEKGPAVAESTPGKLPDSDSGSTEPAVPYCPSDRVTPKKRPPTIREQRQYEACRKNGGMVIVVDPGHGGIDPGAIGHEGTKEKNVTLEVAKRLFQKLDGVQNCKVVLTREDDRFLTLRNRIAIARQAQADLFLSLHADAYRNPIIHGASVFCLADGVQIAIDEKDQQLAHRENTSGNLHASVNPDGNQDSVLELLQLDAIKRMAIADSVRFGHKLIQSLGSQPGVSIHYPRVKRVNFLVLKNPGIPSSLVEMAFLSNVKDEQRMINSEYQERIAQGLASGIFKYFHLPTTDKA